MTRLRVAPEVWDRFAGMTIVVASVTGLDNGPNPAVARFLEAAWEEPSRSKQLESPQAHPHVAAWRTAFKEVLAVSPREFPSSIESLLRRGLKGGDPLPDQRTGRLLQRGFAPASGPSRSLRPNRDRHGHRAQAHYGRRPLHVTRRRGPSRRIRGRSRIRGRTTVLTRHFVWRQARDALVTKKTTSVLLVAEVLETLSSRVIDLVENDFARGLVEMFAAKPHIGRLTSKRPSMWISPGRKTPQRTRASTENNDE